MAYLDSELLHLVHEGPLLGRAEVAREAIRHHLVVTNLGLHRDGGRHIAEVLPPGVFVVPVGVPAASDECFAGHQQGCEILKYEQ